MGEEKELSRGLRRRKQEEEEDGSRRRKKKCEFRSPFVHDADVERKTSKLLTLFRSKLRASFPPIRMRNAAPSGDQKKIPSRYITLQLTRFLLVWLRDARFKCKKEANEIYTFNEFFVFSQRLFRLLASSAGRARVIKYKFEFAKCFRSERELQGGTGESTSRLFFIMNSYHADEVKAEGWKAHGSESTGMVCGRGQVSVAKKTSWSPGNLCLSLGGA
jgi:hypothetical protein